MAQTATDRPGTTPQAGDLKVDFLYFEDCPSHDRALQLLEEVLREEGAEAQVDVRRVETDREAEELRFPGSPTIRINGFDIIEDPALPIGLSCRAYRQPNGRISPLPPRDAIAHAVRMALRAPQIDEADGYRVAGS